MKSRFQKLGNGNKTEPSSPDIGDAVLVARREQLFEVQGVFGLALEQKTDSRKNHESDCGSKSEISGDKCLQLPVLQCVVAALRQVLKVKRGAHNPHSGDHAERPEHLVNADITPNFLLIHTPCKSTSLPELLTIHSQLRTEKCPNQRRRDEAVNPMTHESKETRRLLSPLPRGEGIACARLPAISRASVSESVSARATNQSQNPMTLKPTVNRRTLLPRGEGQDEGQTDACLRSVHDSTFSRL